MAGTSRQIPKTLIANVLVVIQENWYGDESSRNKRQPGHAAHSEAAHGRLSECGRDRAAGIADGRRSAEAVDVLLVNPPTPDGGYWIRTQHRVGRRTRENMVWPQVSLAQMAALLSPTYRVAVIDANAERMGWEAFRVELERYQPKYYVTQMTAPTLENDMYGCFLAHARGAKTIAFGTHVTPIPRREYAAVPEPGLCVGGGA